jgi:uncharacterized spore protein YtfJ
LPELRLDREVRTLPITEGVDVEVACLRARFRREDERSLAGGGLGVSAPVAVRRRSGPFESIPWTALGPIGVVAAMICNRVATRKDEEVEVREPISTLAKVARSEEIVQAFTVAGTGQGVVGPTTTAGERTVVPLIETVFAGGYGGGGGFAAQNEDVGGGGGGGGFARSRTVALVDITPDEVRVKPVVDTTAIVLAAIGLVAGLLGVRRRGRRH